MLSFTGVSVSSRQEHKLPLLSLERSRKRHLGERSRSALGTAGRWLWGTLGLRSVGSLQIVIGQWKSGRLHAGLQAVHGQATALKEARVTGPLVTEPTVGLGCTPKCDSH